MFSICKYCHIPYTNHCSLKSISFGPRCFLRHSSCLCENNGTCVSERMTIHFTTAIVTFMLICGLINDLLSISTFNKKKTPEAGC